jgi:uncharacterized protein (DUF58 family)
VNAQAGAIDSAAPATAARRIVLGSWAWLYLGLGLIVGCLAPEAQRVPSLLAWDLAVLLLFAWDAARLARVKLHAERQIEPRLRMLSESSYTIVLASEAAIALRVTLRDGVPELCDALDVEHELVLRPLEQVQRELRVFPRQRGRAHFSSMHVRRESPLRLAAVIERVAADCEVRVLPEATSERKSDRKGPRLDAGNIALRLRRASQGSELESLREYVPSDPLRAIDWKATAKRRHPVTRLYQPERSQILWFVLDKSRTMAASIGDDAHKTRFDVALEALLVVADGALRAGDQVGVLVQGDGLELVVPPGRGRSHYRRLLDTLSDVQVAPVMLDVRGLIAELERRARKRCLLVLFTDLENETHGEALYQHACVLTRRHLVLCVTLDDSITRALADAPTDGGERAVFQRAAAVDMLRERSELTRRLEKRGVLVLESDEAGLAQATLDRYLEVKTRAQL